MESSDGFWTVQSVAAIFGVFILFLWIKFVKQSPVCKSNTDLTGKTIVITGGNVGVGKATAIRLAKRNARVIIACRNPKKALKAVKDIREQSGNNSVHFMKLDLADFESIREFANEFISTEPRLDILVNNAAVVQGGKTEQGFELMFGTNQLGPFLLTNLLLPLIRKTSQYSPTRIINVCSDGYKWAEIDFENLSPKFDEKTPSLKLLRQYFNSKLMNMYFTMELMKKLKSRGENIAVFASEPGAVSSGLGGSLANQHGWGKILLRTLIMLIIGKSPYYGCQTTVFCCLERDLKPEFGYYYPKLERTKVRPVGMDDKIRIKLWQKCEELCGIDKFGGK